jgi:hypothetical protein
MLWKFDFMVEGENLEYVMTQLADVAVNMQPPRPVTNSGHPVKRIAVGGGKKAHKPQANSMKTHIMEKLRQTDGLISSSQIRTMLIDLGGSPTSSHGLVHNLIKEGVLKRENKGLYSAIK